MPPPNGQATHEIRSIALRRATLSSMSDERDQPRASYVPAHLSKFGSLEALTRSGAGSGNDGGPVADMMMVM